MKHGIVTDGRNTTYYGDAAQRVMARMTAHNTWSQADAEKRLLGTVKGPYRDMLVEEFGRVGFKFEDAFWDKVHKKDEERQKKAEKEFRQRVIDEMATVESLPAKARHTKKCFFCDGPVVKDDDYREIWLNTKANKFKAHEKCFQAAKAGKRLKHKASNAEKKPKPKPSRKKKPAPVSTAQKIVDEANSAEYKGACKHDKGLYCAPMRIALETKENVGFEKYLTLDGGRGISFRISKKGPQLILNSCPWCQELLADKEDV